MTTPSEWPALLLERHPLPGVVLYERGVWGKVHGSPTDFRWIARSGSFSRDRSDLPRQLNLGAEDVPARFQAWRNLGDRCYAMSVYPSRAMDASGRRGFLEKQVLEWHRPPEVPAALGALFLLPQVAAMTDAIWWDRYAGERWTSPEVFLPILEMDHQPIEIGEGHLAEIIERGRQELRETLGSEALLQLYDQILTGRQPAFLPALAQPLTPEGLAALLLPLPREIADQISLTGWVPSGRPVFAELASRWDLFVTAPNQTVGAIPAWTQIRALAMAEELLAEDAGPLAVAREKLTNDEDPFLGSAVADFTSPAVITAVPDTQEWPRPGLELTLTPPEPRAEQILRELYNFARAPNRRWLTPSMLKSAGTVPRFSSHDPATRLLCDWVQQVSKQWPSSYAHKEQWQVKVDLLRSAALILAPVPSTLKAIGMPATDGRIPALFFGILLNGHKQLDSLAGFGEKSLRDLLDQSLSCRGSKSWARQLRQWLREWQRVTQRKDVDVQGLIGDALSAHS